MSLASYQPAPLRLNNYIMTNTIITTVVLNYLSNYLYVIVSTL
jgi:hypothetical protein